MAANTAAGGRSRTTSPRASRSTPRL